MDGGEKERRHSLQISAPAIAGSPGIEVIEAIVHCLLRYGVASPDRFG